MTKRTLLFTLLMACLTISYAGPVDPQTAAVVGLNYWKAHAPAEVLSKAGTPALTNTYTVEEAGMTLYYVFDVSPAGFVIVSGNDASLPVLGFSFEDRYHATDQPEHFAAWMGEYAQRIKELYQTETIPSEQTTAAWEYYKHNDLLPNDKSGEKGVAALCTTKWNQDNYYNYMCPAHPNGPGGHCYAGCVATAMSQVMKYWNWPEQGVGSHSYVHPYYGTISEDFSATTYEWSVMTNTVNSTSKIPIATLMYHCGVAVEMNYSPLGSGSYTGLVVDALKTNFHYRSTVKLVEQSDYTWYDWKMMIKENLDDGMPMVYSGSGSGGGHAWVCDGYSDTSHFHMNFGWGGYNDGYYALDNLTSFPDGHQAVLGIIPYFAPYCQDLRVYTEESRTFGDGSIYSYYWNNTSCEWLIQPTNATDISLAFTQFDTEPGKDIVYVYDGDDETAPLLGSYSGQSLPPVLTSSGGSMLVVFITDGTNQYQGWEAMYNATVVGTPELDDPSSCKIYPNPAIDELTVRFGNGSTEDQILMVTNLTGQNVFEQTILAGTHELKFDVSSWSRGLYLISLQGNGKIQHSKLVLQ